MEDIKNIDRHQHILKETEVTEFIGPNIFNQVVKCKGKYLRCEKCTYEEFVRVSE